MVKKYLSLFQMLVEASDVQRMAILKTLSDQQLRALIEAVYNVLRGVCSINNKDKKKLFNYKTIIRRLVNKELTSKQRHRLLINHQGMLPVLLRQVLKHFEIMASDWHTTSEVCVFNYGRRCLFSPTFGWEILAPLCKGRKEKHWPRVSKILLWMRGRPSLANPTCMHHVDLPEKTMCTLQWNNGFHRRQRHYGPMV